jgi:heme O synthase-like polyprenyltransferase
MIIFYSILLLPIALLLGMYYSLFYFVSALILNSVFIYLSLSLKKDSDVLGALEKKAQTLFFFSILYLFNIFSIILIDNLIWQ